MECSVIKNKEDIRLIKAQLEQTNYRDYVLFTLGINTGIKLQDLLVLKFEDVFDGNNVQSIIVIRDKSYFLHKVVQQILQKFRNKLGNDFNHSDYMFASQKGKEPIDRSHVYRILNNSAKKLNINVNLGTQSLRKTYGYHFYNDGGDLNQLRVILGQSSCNITLKYINIEKEPFDAKKFFL